ncbi:MAG: N-acetylglucosamine-6-sulfatase [Planctomycetota bacterium]|jgi:N-acetylglucosamine-6-sulfatase
MSCGGGAEQAPADPRPNLLLLLTDDQRYDTLSCNGSTLLETPNLDRLASEGARFSRAYVTTSLCCPARASLYTGLYTHTTGVRNNEDTVDFLREIKGFPELLQEAGYDTAFFGKWHAYNPGFMPQPGFDRWVSFDGQGNYDDEVFNIDGKTEVAPGFMTDNLFDLAMEWIGEERDKPFLCVISLKNVHRPYDIPPRHVGLLSEADFVVPASFNDVREDSPAFVQRVRGTRRNGFFEDGSTHAENTLGYHSMVLSIDDNVGRLLSALEGEGCLDSTAFAMTSDGGFMWGEHALYRKRTAYEPSIHIPLLIRYPAEIKPAQEIEQLALGVDIMPTLLDLAGVPSPKLQHGRSLRGLWQGEADGWREDFLYIDGWGKIVDGPQEMAVVGERYKLVRYRRGVNEEALYDRETDPDERRNLIDEPEHAAVAEALRARLALLIEEVGASPTWLNPLEISAPAETR